MLKTVEYDVKMLEKHVFLKISYEIYHFLHISGPGIHPIGSGTHFWSILVLKIWKTIRWELELCPQAESHRIPFFHGHSVGKCPGNFPTEWPELNGSTTLWRNSIDLGYSIEKFPGNFPIELTSDAVILWEQFPGIPPQNWKKSSGHKPELFFEDLWRNPMICLTGVYVPYLILSTLSSIRSWVQ